MLVCQSIEHDLSLVTSDETVQSYPVKTLWR
jgi:PIN domain nuclease of toxin-antitoxin system